MGNTIHGGDDTSIEEEDEIIIPTDDQDEDEDIDDTTEDEDEDEGDGDDADLTPEELKAQLKKAKAIAENQRIRAEKAESKLKNGKPSKVIPSSKKESSDLSNSDMITILKANVAEEDIDDVRKYAKLNGISIKESLASGFMKTLLSQKAEERATAEAAHTGSTRKTASRKSGNQLLSDAQAGNMPDDPKVLAEARLAAKFAKRDSQKKR